MLCHYFPDCLLFPEQPLPRILCGGVISIVVIVVVYTCVIVVVYTCVIGCVIVVVYICV